ncbi:MAG: hypothetical protein GC162_00830 [Planctomycetes bacterium]|nr:hypothetical protein [Planctomycetota bacterium]
MRIAPTAGVAALLITLWIAAGPRAHADDDAQFTVDAARVVRANLVRQLVARFDALTAPGAGYPTYVDKHCRVFPEGRLFPYTLPAIAYGALAADEPDRRAAHLEHAASLLDLAVVNTAAQLKAPRHDLMQLRDMRQQGTWIGQLNLALSIWRCAGGDGRYEALNDHLTKLLVDTMTPLKGKPIDSYPDQSWPFDTAPTLLSIKLHDQIAGAHQAEALIRQHLAWLKAEGTDAATGLPVSRIRTVHDDAKRAPRGCDLSWRLALLAALDADEARRLYDLYVRHFWLERPMIAGFAEWPEGKGDMDVDSGPIVMGIGASASALGIAAARSMHDDARAMRLMVMAHDTPKLTALSVTVDPNNGRATLPGGLPYDPQAVTGMFYGDVTLFYVVTWRDWTPARPAP